MGQESLTRFDQPKTRNRNKNKNKKQIVDKATTNNVIKPKENNPKPAGNKQKKPAGANIIRPNTNKIIPNKP